MSIRADKYKTEEITEGVILEKASIETTIKNMNTIHSYNFENIIPRVNYPIESLKNLIRHNAYLSSAIDILVEGTVGKGFNESPADDNGKKLIVTDPYIIEIIKGVDLRKLQYEFNAYGEKWIEVSIYDNKVVSYWFSPSITWSIGRKKYAKKYVQYYGIKGKEKAYNIFDPVAFGLKRHPNGTFIIHVKNGSEDYGVPKWISADVKAMITKEQDRTTLSYFEHDTRARETQVHYGTNLTTENGKAFKKELDKQQGSDRRGYVNHVFKAGNKAGPTGIGEAMDVIKHDGQVVSDVNLKLEDSANKALVSSLGVPHFMVGLTPPAQLGSGNQSNTLTNFFIDNKLFPAQRENYELWDILFPTMLVMLNIMERTDDNSSTNNDVTMKGQKVENETEKLAKMLIQLEKASTGIKYMEMDNENI